MSEVLELKNIIDDIVSSYETKIENIGSLFEATHLILSEFHQPLLDVKQVREEINSQLQGLLSQNEHLRRKDFDRMMQGILSAQSGKEKEIRDLLNCYIAGQKEMINALRGNLAKIKETIAKGEAVGAMESGDLIAQILLQQDKRKQEVVLKLKEFQKEQKEMTERLLELLAKGRELRIKDLKSMLREFQTQYKQRIARQEERKEEVGRIRRDVQDMLGEFKKKRMESAKHWRAAVHPTERCGFGIDKV